MQIVPYRSVGPIEFNRSNKEDCICSLGMPKSISLNRKGVEELEYEDIIIRLDPSSKKTFECTLLPPFQGTIVDQCIAWDREFLRLACRLDGAPFDVYGFVVLRQLGIAITGIQDNDKSQYAITVFSVGAFDDLLVKGVPYQL